MKNWDDEFITPVEDLKRKRQKTITVLEKETYNENMMISAAVARRWPIIMVLGILRRPQCPRSVFDGSRTPENANPIMRNRN